MKLRIERGPVVIGTSATDPGDMGEPRVFESDGVTYVTVPDFALWSADLDVERLARALLRAQSWHPHLVAEAAARIAAAYREDAT